MAGGRNTFMLVMMFEKGNLVTDAIEMMGCTIVYSRLLHPCPGATGILSPSPPAGQQLRCVVHKTHRQLTTLRERPLILLSCPACRLLCRPADLRVV